MTEQTRISAEGMEIWLDGGILYIKYSKKLTLSVFVESQMLGLDLVKKNGLNIVPLILIYEDEARDGIELSAPDVGKLLTTVDAFRHVSRILIVNAGESHHRIGDMLNKFFLHGHLSFEASLEAAQAEAKKALDESTRLLEPNL